LSGKSKPDKFDLYQRSVQIPGGAAFLAHRYKLITGQPLRSLREDFCGTAYNCCQFVQLHPDNRAIGVDLDESALRWSLSHNFLRLKESQQKRITLVKGNVLTIRTQKVQMIAALNHSYAIFKNRADLLTYFRNARKSLVRSGVMLVDQIGGTDFVNGCIHKSRIEGFVYTAEWSPIDPITHDVNIKISYYFRNRPPMRNVFGYDFRLWSLPELQEILVEAGFRNVHVILECRFKEAMTFRKAVRGHAYDTQNWYAIVIGQA
jgi:hypothetical protein